MDVLFWVFITSTTTTEAIIVDIVAAAMPNKNFEDIEATAPNIRTL
mgnify:CR=1 FL=1|jgi:hypothetical protein